MTGLYDCSSTSSLEVAVRPRCDTDAEEPFDNEIEIDAVRPKSDIDAEKSDDNENEHDAVRSRCGDEAAKNKQEKNKKWSSSSSKRDTWR